MSEDGPTVISGKTAMIDVRDMLIAHRWKSIAHMKVKFDMTPPRTWTVKTFNTMYKVNAHTWAQIDTIMTDVFAQIEAERKAAKAARDAK